MLAQVLCAHIGIMIMEKLYLLLTPETSGWIVLIAVFTLAVIGTMTASGAYKDLERRFLTCIVGVSASDRAKPIAIGRVVAHLTTLHPHSPPLLLYTQIKKWANWGRCENGWEG